MDAFHRSDPASACPHRARAHAAAFAAVANTLALRRDLHGFLDRLGSAGLPLQHVPVSEGGFWLVQQPELVREVLLADDTRVGKPAFLRDSNRGWRGDGLTTLEGPAWKARRAAVMQTVASLPLERRMRWEAREATRRLLQGLPEEVPFDLSDVLLRLVARTALGWTLSADPPDGARQHVPWEEALGAWHRIEPGGSDAGLMPCARLRPPAAAPTLEAIIRRRWREPDDAAGDFLSVFHQACRGQGAMPGEDDVVDEILQWLFAGHHTMSTTLWHALDRLQRHPQARERILACAQRGDGPVACLPPDTYTEAFVKEVMRLCMPTALLFRQTRQPLRLGAECLAANELIAISPYLMQRDPRWFAQPLRFEPKRFEGPIDSHAYLALGAGRRRCAAHRTVLSQLTMVLETVVLGGEVVPLGEMPVNGFSATLPRPGLQAVFHRAL